MVSIYNGILSALNKKEILPHSIIWVSLEDTMLSEMSQSQEDNTVGFHLHEVPRAVKFIEPESTIVVLGPRRKEEGISCCLMGTEFQFCKMKKLHNNVNILNSTEPYT